MSLLCQSFVLELNLADTPDIVDSIAYYCLGELLPIHTNIVLLFLNDNASGCTLINEGSVPQVDGTLKDCAVPAGITPSNSKRQLPCTMKGTRWKA